MMRFGWWLMVAGVLAAGSGWVEAAPPPGQGSGQEKPYQPQVAPASREPLLAMKQIRVPAGLQIDLWAAEPLLANPVAFCIDERNRIYVAETFRIHHGVEDTREHMYWLDDDLACRTVADRVAMFRKHLGDKVKEYAVEHERVRLLEDTYGTGKADKATVFADGFHQIEDGIGAGVLARKGQVWYTCIPSLWLLRDTKGTGQATERKALHTGFGVHVAFYGHDLHGLRFGPDGKLYFSIGDRGSNLKAEGKTFANPDCGAVFRCNPDGSEFEVFATGLRNPQELAFDQYGNLFTGDNNADGGDKARFVYVVEGGDSGWRIGYQYMTEPNILGPWNSEKLWEPQWEGQAAYVVPPIANVCDGPSGLVFYPGVGLADRYQKHFFLCDFRGQSGMSGIRSFAVKPRGASFDFLDQHEFVWSVLATDVDFGMDGAMYILDWVDGWVGERKGRIYKVSDPAHTKDAAVLSVRKLMAEGMDQRSNDDLAKLLKHADQRVRQEAQFALAERGHGGAQILARVAAEKDQRLARLHAIWGLGQLGRKSADVYKLVLPYLQDADAEVRAQAAKLVGEGRVPAALDPLVRLLKDAEPRVRFFAALALGKQGDKIVVPAVLEMLRENADRDVYLRHAGVMALLGARDDEALAAAAQDSSPAVRLAVLLTYRRQGNPNVARFLADAEPRIVLEAARAINDVPINDAFPKLAALIEKSGLAEPLLYRVLNAQFRLGKPENARALATFAARSDVPEALRVEALRELSQWEQPSGRDRVVGLWRPLTARPAAVAAEAIRPALGGVFSGPDGVRQEGAKLAAQLGIREIGPTLFAMVMDRKRPAQVRAEMLRALAVLNDPQLEAAMQTALADADAHLRTEGRRILARAKPGEALVHLEKILAEGPLAERQGALAILGEMKDAGADQFVAHWLSQLEMGKVPAELELDVLEAARQRSSPDIQAKLSQHEAARKKADRVSQFREALAGGDAEAGRRIFHFKAEASCVRCHKVKGEGGEVGPDLTGIGTRQTRQYLLQSIVDPNKEIAKGYESVVVALDNGQLHAGIVKAEDENQLSLMTPEGKLITIPKKRIEDRQRGKSAMPEDIVRVLSKRELRDLVEYLSSLK